MRKYLLKTFDKLYIIDLHGNSNRKESAPDGTPDQNVFDIRQGVSINIFVKNGQKRGNILGEVYHSELYGKRSLKYKALIESNLYSLEWNNLSNREPYYFFVPKDFEAEEKYKQGFKLDTLFKGISGIETKRDHFAIDFDLHSLKNRVSDFVCSDYNSEERKRKFTLRDNEWVVDEAVEQLRKQRQWENSFYPCLYRPFDYRWIIYSNIILARDRGNMMKGMNNDKNIGLVAARQTKESFAILVTNAVCTHKIVTVYDRSFIFPLYVYPGDNGQQTIDGKQERCPNLAPKIIKEIAKRAGLTFSSEKANSDNVFDPIDLLDYIYAVLHSPTYRETYEEFLKIDFPHIPYPKNIDTFWQLVKLGGELRQIHLLESPKVEQYVTTYPQDGNNTVTRKISKKDYELHAGQEAGRVWINDTQYFDNVPKIAWDFYIGGYQPAQKWLKDRHNRELSFEKILHYQKIIVALTETDRIMKEIDTVNFME